MTRFPCPYLRGEVELTDERERHIAEATAGRHWIVTAYMAGKLAEGVVEWKRS
jgi:hypothetical protein